MSAVDNDDRGVVADALIVVDTADIEPLVVLAPAVGHRELPQSLGLVAHLWSTPRGVRRASPAAALTTPVPAPRTPADG
jgi:hypothetical protein